MMKKIIFIFVSIFILISDINLKGQNNESVCIPKENGNIILAYKGFETFLNSEKTWNDYNEDVLGGFPTLASIHHRYIHDGLIDSTLYPKEISDFTMDTYKPYFDRIDEAQIVNIYDSVIKSMNQLLPPQGAVDICFFLPYGKDCFVQDVSGKKTVFISIKYDIDEMDYILIHEYAHCLHHTRRPEEPSVLKRWIISEGIASVFPVLLSENRTIYDGLWMMPKENVDWCIQNEQQIMDSIYVDLDKNSDEIGRKYIAGGEGFSTPPKGFPEKTGYYIGFRMIEKCLNSGISVAELCSLSSTAVMKESGMFN